MIDLIKDYLPWLISCITIYITLLQGNKHPKAWLVALCNQALWLVWIVIAEAWGFIPLNATLWVLYYRNHLKWLKEANQR